MRRALIALLAVVLTAVAVPVLASGLNFNDPKSVEAEINRRIEKKLNEYKPYYEKEQEWLVREQQRLGLQPAAPGAEPSASTPATPVGPKMTCKVGGCSSELCVPSIGGSELSGNAVAGACQYMTFYSCYKGATCVIKKNKDGIDVCGWQDTAELRNCLAQKGGDIALTHAGLK